MDGVTVPLSFDDYPPLMPLVSAVSPSFSFPMSPVVRNETYASFLHIVAEHLADSDRPYMPAGYHSSYFLSPRLLALKVAVREITLNVAPGNALIVESLTVEMLGLQSQIRQRDAEVNALERRLRQRDADVKILQCQVK